MENEVTGSILVLTEYNVSIFLVVAGDVADDIVDVSEKPYSHVFLFTMLKHICYSTRD